MLGDQLLHTVSSLVRDSTYYQRTPKRFILLQAITVFFTVLILLGGWLLWLPISQQAGMKVTFLNCLFTAASATTLTGLVVVSTVDTWSTTGQIILLLLMQLGGLGYMVTATTVTLQLGLRLGFRERLQHYETQGLISRGEIWQVARHTLIITAVIEGIGVIALTIYLYLHQQYATLAQSLFAALFYTVSAFCNVGLNLIHGVQGFTGSPINLEYGLLAIIGVLALLGGIGIPVLAELLVMFRVRRISLHSKLVLGMTLLLILTGGMLFWLFEGLSPQRIFADPGANAFTAGFLAISSRSAGFSPVDVTVLSPPTWLIIGVLMFIGGGPAGTAGGVKVTTVAVIGLAILTLLRRRSDIEIFHRRISGEMVRLALSLVTISSLVIFVFLIGLCVREITMTGLPATAQTMFRYQRLLFEAVSAFSNTGFPSTFTAELKPFSRVLIMLAMFIGRLGPLAFVCIFAQLKKPLLRRLPAETIIVG